MRRREDERILRGRSCYLDDLDPPGVAHVAFVRSIHAHARVRGISTPTGQEGLLGVFTAADLVGRASALPIQAVKGATLADEPHPILACDEVRYAGQPVVAVVAESRALAEDLAELVEVDYEPLPAVVDPRTSDLALVRWEGGSGDVDGAFAAAAHVVRATHAIPRLVAAPMETRGALAENDRATGRLTVWCAAQDPHRPLAQLAHVLDRDPASIRLVVPDVGGAFGSKGALAPEAAVVALAAMTLGRPVKWAEDRLENFLAGPQGRGVQADVELALDADGRMLALRAHIVADLGAYLLPTTAVPPHTMAMLMTGCYEIGAAAVTLVGARTHKVPTAPYRGAGRPEAAYVLERTVDVAARQIGLDPVDLRRRNLISTFPHATPLGWTYDSGDYRRCLDRAVELVKPEHGGNDEQLVGTGVALYVERAGGLWESARVTVEPGGGVIVRSGSSPHGQGHETTFAQIAADRLGMAMDDVELRFGDSADGPAGVGTFASRSVAMGGSAIVVAIDELIERCRALAAHLLDVGAHDVLWNEGRCRVPDGRELSLSELVEAAHDPGRRRPGSEPGLETEARFSSDLVFSSGAYAAVVEIERATGRLTVRRLAAVDDPGRVINPLLAEGQVIGGTVQGLGAALVEEAVHDEGGQLRTGTFAEYSLLTAAEVPPIATDFVESPSPLNPLGAKGIGEGGAIGTPAAIANAVSDALGGVAIDPPFTARRLWLALSEAR